MIKSMTGYARVERAGEWGRISWEMRSVNHRYLDVQFKMPDEFRALESELRVAAGARLVIEECLSGPEVSAFYLCDGHRAVDLSTAQDHKRIFDDDCGPNTGGMGAFSPSPLVTPALAASVRSVNGPNVSLR